MIGRFRCLKSVSPPYGRFWQFTIIEDGFWFAARFERSESDPETWVRVK